MSYIPFWSERARRQADVDNLLADAMACFIAGVIMAAVLLFQGCSSTPGAKTPARDVARAVVVTLAKATAGADLVCASIAMAQKDAAIAKACADSYDVARPALLAAEAGIDAWEDGESGRIACLVVDGATALSKTAETITKAGGKVPLDVADALKFATSIAGVCRRG